MGTLQALRTASIISLDVVQVFWNRESNEIIKFLGHNVYAHFDSESECPIRDDIKTIKEQQYQRTEYHVLKEVKKILFHFTKFYNDRRAFCFPFFSVMNKLLNL